MNEPVQELHIEPRWPVALTLLAVIVMLALLPGRVRLFPDWAPYALGVALAVPMAAVALAGEKTRWLRIERIVVLLFCLVSCLGTMANLANLVVAMIHKSTGLSGLQLLASSISVWVTNVLAYSMIYWLIDRGGPEARANGAGERADWLFPQAGAGEDVPPGWQPIFVDYLYLGYSTATAFSTTDVMPLTSRAKLLMMLESTISLMTIVVVAARAINILG
jgi:uncharacterized membrane protein